MNIRYIDMIMSNYETFRVYKEDIMNLEYTTEQDKSDYDLGSYIDINIINYFYLRITSMSLILNIDSRLSSEFSSDRRDISQIVIYDNDENEKFFYINMTNEDYNENQKNSMNEYGGIIIEIKEN